MFRYIIVPNVLLLLAMQVAIAGDVPEAPVDLTAAQIVEKNVTARGGLQAWRVTGGIAAVPGPHTLHLL